MSDGKGPEHDEDELFLERFQPLLLKLNTAKGRGVFASVPIPARTTIDISPVLILSPDENKAHIEKTELFHYTYNWPSPDIAGTTTQAVVFGLGSMFNHSALRQNVGWKRDLKRKVIIYSALRDIKAGEELCISYGDRLTFEDVERKERDEDAKVEDPNVLLGRIEFDEEE